MLRFDRWSLQGKLIAAFVGIGVMPAAFNSYKAFSDMAKVEDLTARNYSVQAAQLNDTIDRNLFERYGDVQAFGANRVVHDRQYWHRIGSDENPIAAAANTYVQLYGLYDLSYLVDLDGRLIAVNDKNAVGKDIDTAWMYQENFSNDPWFKAVRAEKYLTSPALSGTVVEDVHVDARVKRAVGGECLVVGFSAPVKDAAGHVIAVWTNRAGFAVVEQMLRDKQTALAAQGLPTAQVLLHDRVGKLLAHYQPAVAGRPDFLRDMTRLLQVDEATDRVASLDNGGSDAVRFVNAEGEAMIDGIAASSGALGYAGLGWRATVRLDEASAFEDAIRMRRQALLSLLATVLLLSGVAWTLGRALSRPIMHDLSEIEDGSHQVTSASSQVAESAQSLSQGATEQAASLEETSASMEQIATMTESNSSHATVASEHMSGVDERIVDSTAALEALKASMHAIQESSTKVAKIIKAIDEIAFQTNILALNAAVEAARAGEAGMGFAVVADEVRNLAQRSAQAARDTSQLIEESTQRAQQGARDADAVAGSVTRITQAVLRARDAVREVTEASAHQRESIRQVTQAIREMEKVTQTTAATAEQSAAASEQLSAQAESTTDIVRRLKERVEGAGSPQGRAAVLRFGGRRPAAGDARLTAFDADGDATGTDGF